MPTYAYRCGLCSGEFEHWSSIHEPSLTVHGDCGGSLLKILGPVRTHGVGTRGIRTREVDAKEADWSKDMAAYRRFRNNGHQPRGIDGADHLEATADNEFVIKYGDQARGFSETRLKDGMAEARDIVEGRIA